MGRWKFYPLNFIEHNSLYLLIYMIEALFAATSVLFVVISLILLLLAALARQDFAARNQWLQDKRGRRIERIQDVDAGRFFCWFTVKAWQFLAVALLLESFIIRLREIL